MTASRIDIEKALDELISNEEGMKFQGLAVILAKQKWPDLVACERKKDLGLDAYASASLADDRFGKGLACSLTATLQKIKSDAKKIQDNFNDVQVLIFVTPQGITNQTSKRWADEIAKIFGYELIVMSREDIIMSLMVPSNASICRTQLGIPMTIEESVAGLIEKAREATAEVAAAWLANPRLTGKPLIPLQAVKLNQEGKDTEEIFQLERIQALLREGCRVIIEAPAGRGKTTTLVQLAKQGGKGGGLAFLIDLPAWSKSGLDILGFITRLPPFQSHDINARHLAKISQEESFSFLLNGWNEVSEIHSEDAAMTLRQLERSFPAAGIVVATRTHHVSPPLPGAFRVRLLPLTENQRAEYLKQALGNRADELRSKLDNNPALDELTRTPLVLSEVTTIFRSGSVIPKTKIGVLETVMRLLEKSEEHQSYLQTSPLMGHAQSYLAEMATQMTSRGDTTINEEEARRISHTVSISLREAGQLTTLPEPASILNTLCAHHVLERLAYPSDVFRLEHQQFQELYAALLLKRQLGDLEEKDNEDRIREFTKQYVNEPTWEESLLMVAEEIGVRSDEMPSDLAAVRIGKRLIEMTLTVDPVFAGQLSYLCGKIVWKEVRSKVGECLRSWYRVADHNHRRCALAGMLATGSDDFVDITLPLLTSDNQQVRLGTYRAAVEFHPTSLGQQWRDIVKGWVEDARIEFVLEVTSHRKQRYIAIDFALGDASPRVRAAAIQALSWAGEEVDKLLEALDEEGLKKSILKMAPRDVPPLLHRRALAFYQDILSESKDPLTRLRFLIKAAELGEADIAAKVKDELANLPLLKAGHEGDAVTKTAINIVWKTNPEWVSRWVAGRIMDGSLGHEGWIGLVTSIPEEMKEKLLQKIEGEDLQHAHGITAILAATADSFLAETLFSRLCTVHRSISPDKRDPTNKTKWTSIRQMEDLLRTLSPNILVSGLLEYFAGEFDTIQFLVMIDVFSTVGRDEPDLKSVLQEDLREGLRRYLKNGLNFVLKQDDFSGEMKAHLASALARVGNPEDNSDLAQLIEADIERVRKGRAARARGERSELANGAGMSYADWHVRALISLDPGGAEAILLKVLLEQEYEGEAASALVRLARIQSPKDSFNFKPRDYSVIWEARAGRRPDEFYEERRQRYTTAIKQRISALLAERAGNPQKTTGTGRLKGLAGILAILDSHDSAELIMHVMAFPGEWDGWGRVKALESLLFRGALLPTEATLNVLNPTIEHTLAQGLYNNQNVWLLKGCLCLLPFVDHPSIGLARIKQVVSQTKFPVYELRDIVTAVAGCRCDDEALGFLRQIAGTLGDRLKHIRKEWIKAIAAVGSQESKEFLLSFLDAQTDQFLAELRMDNHESDILASLIADIALQEDEKMQHILRLCDLQLSPTKRSLLCKVIARLGTFDAVSAGLNLIDDAVNPPIPYELERAMETVFIEQRPYGKTGFVTLLPRGSNDVKAKLFEMALTDERRKKSAFALLGQIEVWRLEYGRPSTETRHPAFGTGVMWPVISSLGDLS